MIYSGSEISLLKTNIFEELENDTITLKDSDITVTQANGEKNGIKWYSSLAHWGGSY